MKLFDNLSAEVSQSKSIIIENGESFYIELYFIPMQYTWMISKLTYNDTVIENIRLCNSPNILRQFKNILPFGLCCISDNPNREPSLAEDFESGASKLYLLSSFEVEQYEEFLRDS